MEHLKRENRRGAQKMLVLVHNLQTFQSSCKNCEITSHSEIHSCSRESD